MKRKDWFRRSRKQDKPPEKKAEEYSVDEILTEFRNEDDHEPEAETKGEGVLTDVPEEVEVQQEKEPEKKEIYEPEDASTYSVHDILREYWLLRDTENAEESETGKSGSASSKPALAEKKNEKEETKIEEKKPQQAEQAQEADRDRQEPETRKEREAQEKQEAQQKQKAQQEPETQREPEAQEMPEAREEAPETAEKTEDVKNLTTSISKSSSESYSADAESLVAGSSLKAGDEHSFHNIMDEFLRMPDQGEHAPTQQKMPEARTAAGEENPNSQTGRGEGSSLAGRWFSSSARKDRHRTESAGKSEQPQTAADRAPAGKIREVKEEFPENPNPGNGEPFVDNLDYAAIFKMFADPEEAGRFEEVKPDSEDDPGVSRLLDKAAEPNAGAESPAEEKTPLFAENNPDFRGVLREYMMGDQHPIYADIPGIGKKADDSAEMPPEEKKAPAPRRRREHRVEEDFPESFAAGEDETPAPRRRREYAVEESFPESSAAGAAEPSDGTEQPAGSAAEDGERPEKAAKLDKVRNFLSGLSIRRTESGKQALNSPRAFARFEDYLPDEETALKAEQAARQAAERAETEAGSEAPAEGEDGEAEGRPERAGAHLDNTEEKTEAEQAAEDDALLYAGDFPSFGQWILNELMGFWIKLNGVGDRQSTATMQDDREELGSEVNVANASRYYGSQVTMLRMRVEIGLAVLAILAYITLGFPVSGMLKTAKVAAGMCLALQLTVMLLCLDIVTNAAINLTRGRFGADALAVLACLISCFDALAVAMGAFGTPHIPLCLFSSLALMGILFADLLSARALRKSLRVPAIGKRAYCVTAEEGVRGGREITLLKSVRPLTGFVRRSEETPPDEMLFSKSAFIELLVVLVLSLLIGLVKHSMKDMLYILSAMLSCTVPVTALLAFALPFFIGSQRIFSSGAAVAGWSGVHDIGCSRNLIVTDRDLFPEETVAIETVRVFADESAERVISYAGTMIAASGSGLGPCFADLMEKNGCRMCKVEDFKWLSGGGLQGLIEGHTVLCGGADLMQLMNVKVPYRLVDQTTVLLSIDGVLYGIFKINYTGLPEIRAALQDLIASNRHPIFAIRDFIITPEMLHNVFDVATDGYDFPPYGDRFRISEAKPSELSQVSAVVCREGLGPLTHLADTGRSMYVAIRMNLIITLLTAVAGTLLVFFRLIGPGILNVWLPFVLMLLDAIFVLLVSLFMRF